MAVMTAFFLVFAAVFGCVVGCSLTFAFLAARGRRLLAPPVDDRAFWLEFVGRMQENAASERQNLVAMLHLGSPSVEQAVKDALSAEEQPPNDTDPPIDPWEGLEEIYPDHTDGAVPDFDNDTGTRTAGLRPGEDPLAFMRHPDYSGENL